MGGLDSGGGGASSFHFFGSNACLPYVLGGSRTKKNSEGLEKKKGLKKGRPFMFFFVFWFFVP